MADCTSTESASASVLLVQHSILISIFTNGHNQQTMNKIHFMILSKFNWKLLLLFCILGFIIIFSSYYDINGGLTPDSTYYLQLSQSLLDGNGFQRIAYETPEGRTLFAIWPVGYPTLIFILAKLTGLSVFWASKLLNILVIGCCLIVFQFIFKGNAHWVGLIFLCNSFSSIYKMTWSEGVFLFFLLVFCLTVFQYIKTDGKNLWLIIILFSGLLLFITRYIGAFTFIVTGIVILFLLIRKKWLSSIKLSIVLFLQILISALYLYNNKLLTGYFTGMPRGTGTDISKNMFSQLFFALKEELVLIPLSSLKVVVQFPISATFMSKILTFLLLFLLGLYLYNTSGKKSRFGNINGLWVYFILIAILYLISITFMVWKSNVTDLDYRYLVPATFLAILSVAAYLQSKPKINIKNSWIYYLLILVFLGFLNFPNYVIYRYIKEKGDYIIPNYPDNMAFLQEKYRSLESKSIVIYGSPHIRHLRKDLIPTDLYTGSSLDDVIKYFKSFGNWNIYIEIKHDLNPINIHESVINFMKEHQEGEIVRIE